MIINFLIPCLYIGGGIRVVFEYANNLCRRGHQVNILYPIIPATVGDRLCKLISNKSYIKHIIVHTFSTKSGLWFPVTANLIKVPIFNSRYIPNADITVATSWPTSYIADKLPTNKGTKVYFIQGYETFIGPKELVENSYKLPLFRIVVSSMLHNLLKDKFDLDSRIIMNGVNFDYFYNTKKRNIKRKRILMLYHPAKFKGIADGVKIFEIARKEYPDIELVMFGNMKGKDIPSYVEFHKTPTQDRLRDIYSSCDIFLSPSYLEGFNLCPLEAMACKCATVLTNVGAVKDYAVHEETALIGTPGDIETMASYLKRLLKSNHELIKIAEAGYHHVQRFTWAKATDELLAIFSTII